MVSGNDCQTSRSVNSHDSKVNFITKEHGLLSWLLTGDHKRIAMMYLPRSTFFFAIGGSAGGPDPAGTPDAPIPT